MTDASDQSRLPLEQRIPPTSVASPSQMRLDPNERDVPWYKPTFAESARLFGWRWIYFLPIFAVLALIVWVTMRPSMIQFALAWWKLEVFAIALPVTLAISASKNIIAQRKEPFCIHCGYDLTGLADNHNCPECGRSFSFAIIDEYRRDPHWFIERYKKRHDVPRADVPFHAGAIKSRKKSRDGT